MEPLQSTLADLTAAKIVAYYPPPAPDSGSVQGSTDPNVYVNDPNYIKELNRHAFHRYAVDVPNQSAANQLDFAAKQWEANKSATSIPKPGISPVSAYVQFDDTAFDQWWQQYNHDGLGTMGENAPPLFFVKPYPNPPDIKILAEGQQPPPQTAATDGPIGSAVPNNPGVFNSSSADSFPDGYIYAGPTGIYQKHIYTNPFTAGNTRVIWMKLQ